MKKKSLIISLVIVMAAVAFYYFYFRSGRDSKPVSFVAGKAQYGYIAKSITATGTVQPVDTVSVGAQVSGVVKNVYVDFNDVVRQGQLLAKVDPSIINAQLDQVKATLANAQTNLQYQQSNYDRQTQLYNLGAISKSDFQVALNQYNMARAALANASAQLKLNERNLYYTNIYSPINGVVLNRNVSEGQTIASSFNAPVLFVIARDLTKMQVRAAVDEADIGGVRTGQRVTFTVDAYPDDVFEGHVQDILLHPTVSANVVTYSTLIDVDNESMKLRPGMTTSINVFIQEDSNALLIPSRALNFKPDTSILKKYTIQRAEGTTAGAGKAKKNFLPNDTTKNIPGNEAYKKSFVWTRHGDTLTERRILTGMTDDSYVKVVGGLLPEEEVITNMVVGGNNNADEAQRSPFMPQMRRRTTTSGGTAPGQRN
jgi:HlyD family secretion protein